jgi:hypothetical protein
MYRLAFMAKRVFGIALCICSLRFRTRGAMEDVVSLVAARRAAGHQGLQRRNGARSHQERRIHEKPFLSGCVAGLRSLCGGVGDFAIRELRLTCRLLCR